MDLSAPRAPDPPAPFPRGRAVGIIATATVLGLLYFGRDVLVPIALAAILSLLIAPLVRGLRRIRMGQTPSVLVAVTGLALAVAAATAVIGVQVVKMTASLPQYEETIRHKLASLNAMTVGRLQMFNVQAVRMLDQNTVSRRPVGTASTALQPEARQAAAPLASVAPLQSTVALPAAAQPAAPIPVEIHNPPANSLDVLQKVVGSVWVPLETAGIVLVVLIFLLLEHETVRDRFIRIAGGNDIRATTLALNDAGERLSRFFISQFRVNFGVACAVWLGLTIVGLPHALLWGAMTGVLRFVPYVGVWIAAVFSTVLAAAVDPGWTLAVATLSLYVIVELIAGQLIEPQLYGHATGLSPLSVVVAAIFWSWLWGPIGLIVSTPLTLCLVVAGRHIKGLSLLDVMLGNSQPLTMPQRLYQRALSGDSEEIVGSAKAFLKRNSFAAYCDVVLMPALSLARLDLTTGAISAEQQVKVRDVMVAVIGAIGSTGGFGRGLARRRARGSVLDPASIGRRLRTQREQLAGPYQGPLSVPAGSVMLCVSLGSSADDLATELLVRILRDQQVDARHLSIEDVSLPVPPGASADSVAMVYLVSAFPSEERERGEWVVEKLHERLPVARLVTVFLPGMLLQPGPAIHTIRSVDKSATSFGEALQIGLDVQDKSGGAAAREL